MTAPAACDSRCAYRATLVHCIIDHAKPRLQRIDDGVLIVHEGRIERIGPAAPLLDEWPAEAPLVDYRGHWIVPGFIDTHIHYPQTDMIAAHGEQLLEWLERYTFPSERRFADPAHAAQVAEFFLDELLRNGVTSACVLASVHPHSVDAILTAAQERGMRLIAGKVLMDRNCPEDLRDTPRTAYADSRALIERWHGRARLGYAITPRFAPTSTPEQLREAGRLAREYPEVLVHTHLAENRAEVQWVAELFPEQPSYLAVYDTFGLVRERSLFAHCIHLDRDDRARMAEAGATIAFCPSANLFLGSGCFDYRAALDAGVTVGLGSDVGAGTSFNPLRTLSEAYKIGQLSGASFSVDELFYLATLGSARALALDDRIGNFETGKEADFVVLDPEPSPLLRYRMHAARSFDERLFALIMLGDERAVRAVYLNGVLHAL